MIYLDHAATSFPKPHRVVREMEKCLSRYGGNPGRGAHLLSRTAAETVFRCRETGARLFSLKDPLRLVFTENATMALNIAIQGLLRKGDHVLISDMEHNAVWRPIEAMQRAGIISYDTYPSMACDREMTSTRICAGIARRLRSNTRMVIACHSSNICSYTAPIKEIGAFCHRHGLLFLVDGAQSAGHIPIHMEEDQIDALCLPGHKGLLGPQGSGMLLLGEGICPRPLLFGGSGYASLEPQMPRELPERLEAGTLPTPAIAGLLRGMEEVERVGLDHIRNHQVTLGKQLTDGLQRLPGIHLYAPHHPGGVVLFSIDGKSADQLGKALDEKGFCVRTGFHCAPLAHKTLQTPPDGAVRVSVGASNIPLHIDLFLEAMEEIVKQ